MDLSPGWHFDLVTLTSPAGREKLLTWGDDRSVEGGTGWQWVVLVDSRLTVAQERGAPDPGALL